MSSLIEDQSRSQPLKLSIDMDDSIARFISPSDTNVWIANTAEVLRLRYLFENRIVQWVLSYFELATVLGTCFVVLLGFTIAEEPRSSGAVLLYFFVLFVASFVLIAQVSRS